MMSVGDITSTPRVFTKMGGYSECTWEGGCSVHPRDSMGTPGNFGKNEEKLPPNLENFRSRTFYGWYSVHVALWNMRKLE